MCVARYRRKPAERDADGRFVMLRRRPNFNSVLHFPGNRIDSDAFAKTLRRSAPAASTTATERSHSVLPDASPDPHRSNRSALVCRNVWIGSRRTSVRLEPAFWDLLERAAAREEMSIHDVCTRVSDRAAGYGLTGAIRVFLVCYAWTARMVESLDSVPAGRLPQARPPGGQRDPV